jgi:hypothetical protein
MSQQRHWLVGAAMLLALASQHPGFCSLYCVVGRQRDTVKHQKHGAGGNLACGIADAEMRLGCWGEGARMAKRGE